MVRDRSLLIILFLVAVSRLPYIFVGYGADHDAWRVARSALTLWNTGTYEVSRFPGYPLHEFLMAPFVASGGHILSNSVTLAAALVLIFLWNRLTLRMANHPVVLTIALAFTPLFWKGSAATMDYTWTLLFLILALDAGTRSKAIAAGMWLGIAAGFRPTTLLALLPLAVLIYFKTRSTQNTIRFTGAAIATALVALSPLFLTYGLAGWVQNTLDQTSDVAFTASERALLFGYRLIYSIGPLATVSVFTIVILRRNALTHALRQSEPVVASSVIGVLSFVTLFLLFPLEREYLLPALPFLLLLLDRLATRTTLVVFTACLISFAFINIDFIIHEGKRGRPGFNIHEGYLLDDWNKRHLMVEAEGDPNP